MQQRADEALGYLIWLCGYNGEFKSIAKNESMMTVDFLLISEIKARAITCFKFSPESLTADFNFNINDQNMSNRNNCEFDEKKFQEIETFFRENLSNTQYAEAQDKISDLTDCGVEMRRRYLIYKDVSKEVEGYKINNAEYDGADTQTSLLENLAQNKDDEIELKTNKQVPEFLFWCLPTS